MRETCVLPQAIHDKLTHSLSCKEAWLLCKPLRGDLAVLAACERLQSLASSLHANYFSADGRPRCTAAQRVPLLMQMSTAATATLLLVRDPACAQPRSLVGLDTCSLLLHSTSCVLRAIAMHQKDPSKWDYDTPAAFQSQETLDNLVRTGALRSPRQANPWASHPSCKTRRGLE